MASQPCGLLPEAQLDSMSIFSHQHLPHAALAGDVQTMDLDISLLHAIHQQDGGLPDQAQPSHLQRYVPGFTCKSAPQPDAAEAAITNTIHLVPGCGVLWLQVPAGLAVPPAALSVIL